ncbi:MAG: ABC transporter ATP-binding protein [Bacteroidales bacterium]|jgi:ABC-2 type transport system ATP-binding protein|nr:ABC transporter ATP-binding protein [Bacteroidales bacterium]
MLQAIELTKRYEDEQLALDALSLDIKAGEIFFLLGANGAGKTTTINLFLNFIEPTSGKILIDGIDVVQNPLETKRHVSYVSENVMLYGNFTARQNLDFFAKLGGKTRLTRHDYYTVMRNVGLQEEAFEKKLKTFSKGMRQKVGLAIAIIKDAPNILLDEPTSGLDPKSASELMQLLLQLRSRGKSILMCTHDIFRAKSAADRVGIMKEGRLVMLRTREQFLQDDLERIYLDYMQEAMMDAETVNERTVEETSKQ